MFVLKCLTHTNQKFLKENKLCANLNIAGKSF